MVGEKYAIKRIIINNSVKTTMIQVAVDLSHCNSRTSDKVDKNIPAAIKRSIARSKKMAAAT